MSFTVLVDCRSSDMIRPESMCLFRFFYYLFLPYYYPSFYSYFIHSFIYKLYNYVFSIPHLTITCTYFSHKNILFFLFFRLIGIGCSVLFYLADLAFSDKTAPFLMSFSKDNNGIDGE